MTKNPRQPSFLLFTSLPKVGGHSSITLGLCRMLRPHFSEIEVWCKTMPGHGHSAGAQREIEQLGCRVVRISDDSGRLHLARLARCMALRRLRPPGVFLSLAMRHLSPLLAVASGARRSVYYHITHDLNTETVRRLVSCRRIFSKLTFICPATEEAFRHLTKNAGAEKLSWIPQPSEIPVLRPELLAGERRTAQDADRRFRFGLIGRLTREKGAEEMLRFVERCPVRCELHVAGAGPFADAFSARAAVPVSTVRVIVHGAYDPATRAGFLRDFFAHIDAVVVPSLDEWETLSMAALEALQHGVPAILCRTGGLVSFAHPALGPAPEDVVRLVDPARLVETLEQTAASGGAPTEATSEACRRYYAAHFCTAAIERRWLDLCGISVAHPAPGGPSARD